MAMDENCWWTEGIWQMVTNRPYLLAAPHFPGLNWCLTLLRYRGGQEVRRENCHRPPNCLRLPSWMQCTRQLTCCACSWSSFTRDGGGGLRLTFASKGRGHVCVLPPWEGDVVVVVVASISHLWTREDEVEPRCKLVLEGCTLSSGMSRLKEGSLTVVVQMSCLHLRYDEKSQIKEGREVGM
jgi:hypothetical protein